MDDIAPELYERLKAEYERRRGSAADAAEKAKGYRDVLSWADHVGRSAALTFDGILPEELPDGVMHYNIAERTLQPVLEEVAADVLTVARAAQDALNTEAGIEMAFQVPDEADKIKGLVNLACAGPTWEERQDEFCDATQTFASKTSDDCIRQNAGSQYDAGMSPKIIRSAGAGACKWCSDLVGSYDYGKEPHDVYRRHVGCNCIVEYIPKKGMRQNVHTKSTVTGFSHDSENVSRMVNTLNALLKEGDYKKIHSYISAQEGIMGFYTPDTLRQALLDAGYKVTPLKRGSHAGEDYITEGGGYRAIIDNNGGIIYHPTKGSHHDGAYYKIYGGNGLPVLRYSIDGKKTPY